MSSKKVLFIHINFYEYNQRIVNKMRELGYEVDCFCEDISFNYFEKMLCKLNPQYAVMKSSKTQDEFIRNMVKQNIKYDLIFVIKGEKLSSKFLYELKRLNSKAHFILYLWDDIARVSSFFDNRKFYDKIFSFDKIDAKQYDLSFLPLFFCDEFRIGSNSKKHIDIYFSGWNHSNRRNLIEKILPAFNNKRMKVYIHLFTERWKTFKDKMKKLSFKKEPEYIKYNTMSLQQNAELTKDSRVLIDIQHPTQTGLTMRTIEALAAKAKLITTNSEVTRYDFYNPNNILVIEPENPRIDYKFVMSPYEDVSEKIVESYSLTSWLKTILESHVEQEERC